MAENTICPYCQSTAESDGGTVTCPRCSAVHHEECWRDNGGCAVVSCEVSAEVISEGLGLVVCGSCGHSEPAGSRFCGGCGRELAGSAAPPAASPPKLPGLGGSLGTPIAAASIQNARKPPWRTIGVVAAIAAVLLVLVIALTAGPSQEDRTAEAKANYDACESGAGDMLDAALEIQSRIQLSINYYNYQDLVAEANVAYSDVTAASLDPACNDDVYEPATAAMELYISAEDEWSSCVYDDYCDAGSDIDVESKWSDATDRIDEANAGLEAIRQPPSGGD